MVTDISSDGFLNSSLFMFWLLRIECIEWNIRSDLGHCHKWGYFVQAKMQENQGYINNSEGKSFLKEEWVILLCKIKEWIPILNKGIKFYIANIYLSYNFEASW